MLVWWMSMVQKWRSAHAPLPDEFFKSSLCSGKEFDGSGLSRHADQHTARAGLLVGARSFHSDHACADMANPRREKAPEERFAAHIEYAQRVQYRILPDFWLFVKSEEGAAHEGLILRDKQ
jgi:hypothetical protein